MALEGSLDMFSVKDVLGLLLASRASGALHLTRRVADGETDDVGLDHAVVYLHEGQIYCATATSAENIYGALVDCGDINTIGSDEVSVRACIDDVAFWLLGWNEGTFVFTDEMHPSGVTFSFPCETVLAAARRRLDIWEKVIEVMPSVEMGVTLCQDLPESADNSGDVTLSQSEWRVVAALSGGCTIQELAARLRETVDAIRCTLYTMHCRGMVALHAAQPKRRDTEAEWPVAEVPFDEAAHEEPEEPEEPEGPEEPEVSPAGTPDEEFDKGLILRLIAGIRGS